MGLPVRAPLRSARLVYWDLGGEAASPEGCEGRANPSRTGLRHRGSDEVWKETRSGTRDALNCITQPQPQNTAAFRRGVILGRVRKPWVSTSDHRERSERGSGWDNIDYWSIKSLLTKSRYSLKNLLIFPSFILCCSNKVLGFFGYRS